jgi:hypothetical membrane protein
VNKRVFWLVGIVTPVFFTLAVAILGGLKPGYSHVYHTISELGETGSVTATQSSIVFILTGLMIMIFGYGLHIRLIRGDRHVWSGILIILYGLLDFVGSGIFPVDPGGTALTRVSVIHVYATLLGEFAAVSVPVWFHKDTEGLADWSNHRLFSKKMFYLSLLLMVFLGYCIVENTPSMSGTPIGLAQRLLVGDFLFWIMVTAYRLMKK